MNDKVKVDKEVYEVMVRLLQYSLEPIDYEYKMLTKLERAVVSKKQFKKIAAVCQKEI